MYVIGNIAVRTLRVHGLVPICSALLYRYGAYTEYLHFICLHTVRKQTDCGTRNPSSTYTGTLSGSNCLALGC